MAAGGGGDSTSTARIGGIGLQKFFQVGMAERDELLFVDYACGSKQTYVF
jgi:hypothetical protein